MKKAEINIQNLRMNRLRGRFLRVTSRTTASSEILVLPDVAMNLEMLSPLSQELGKHGNVTVVDLPGSGGMTSFYSIGQSPDIEQYASYIASFIKLRFKRRRVKIVCVGYSLAFVTRLLQRYPSVSKKVDVVVSLSGFLHTQDLALQPSQRTLLRIKRNLQSTRFASMIAHYTSMQPSVIASSLQSRNIQLDDEYMANVVAAWRQLHIRTYRKMQLEQLRFNLCQQQLPTPLHYVHYPYYVYNLESDLVEAHLRVAYKKVTIHRPKPKEDLLVALSKPHLAQTLLSKNITTQL